MGLRHLLVMDWIGAIGTVAGVGSRYSQADRYFVEAWWIAQ